MIPRALAAALAVALGVVASGCGSTFRPFTGRAIVWRDDDMRPFPGPIPEQSVSWMWDAADNTIFRQVSEALRYRRPREAINVNALDEVPDSSWFTNRLSRAPMSREELVLGPCESLDPPPPPYVVVRGKGQGETPGAVIEASDGTRYLMKTDLWGQPERGTAADAIATRLLHAAGYTVPCNVVAHVRAEQFVVPPGTTFGEGDEGPPFTPGDLEDVLEEALVGPEGGRRVILSRYMDGEPLGGFLFSGTRDDDPNDVVPHEHRRELRGLYAISAWMNHVDARAENNLDLWIETGEGQGYVRHAILDAGDSFGIVWGNDLDDAMSRRLGHSHYLDFEHILGDLATLGIAERAYRDTERGPAFEVLGYFDVERFDPDEWRSGYPNPAFEQRTEADVAWMARILARFDEASVRAIVQTGRFSRALHEDELVRILMGRRARLLERYLVRLSPLSFPELENDTLCLRDLAVESGLRSPGERAYSARAYLGIPPAPLRGALVVRAEGSRVCVRLPSARADYRIVDLIARTPGRETSGPARVHLRTDRDAGGGAERIAGLERPEDATPP